MEPKIEQFDAELAVLNAEVEAAIAKRKAWMDAHMVDYAKYQIGETLYDLKTGAVLGVISRLYRYWGGRDARYDTHMSVEYEFKTPHIGYDNTSRHAGGLSFGNHEDLIREKESQLRMARLRGPDGAIEWAKLFAPET